MTMRLSFQTTKEQAEKLKTLERYVNLSQLLRDSLDIVLANIDITVKS